MSGEGHVQRGIYDGVELRRRIAICFTAAELQRLAEQLGVGAAVPIDRGTEVAARELIKQFERFYGVDMLVAKLRETRPLVEWPDPIRWESTPAPAEASAPVADAEPTVVDPAPPSSAHDASPASLAAPASAPAPISGPPPASAPWPGTVTPAAPSASKGIDPRIFVAVSALTLLAAIVAFLAGRASSDTKAPATADSAKVAARRPEGPATHAADTLERSLANVARACEVPLGGDDVFKRIFERCGPAPLQKTPAIPRPVTTDAPVGSADDQPVAPRPPKTRDPVAPMNGCVSACDRTHASCRSRCGSEPSEASKYGEYQQCLARCLSVASKCRLGCQ